MSKRVRVLTGTTPPRRNNPRTVNASEEEPAQAASCRQCIVEGCKRCSEERYYAVNHEIQDEYEDNRGRGGNKTYDNLAKEWPHLDPGVEGSLCAACALNVLYTVHADKIFFNIPDGKRIGNLLTQILWLFDNLTIDDLNKLVFGVSPEAQVPVTARRVIVMRWYHLPSPTSGP